MPYKFKIVRISRSSKVEHLPDLITLTIQGPPPRHVQTCSPGPHHAENSLPPDIFKLVRTAGLRLKGLLVYFCDLPGCACARAMFMVCSIFGFCNVQAYEQASVATFLSLQG